MNLANACDMPYYKCTFRDQETYIEENFETYARDKSDAKARGEAFGTVTGVTQICRTWSPFSSNSFSSSRIIPLFRLFHEMLSGFCPVSSCLKESLLTFRNDKKMYLTLKDISQLVYTGVFLSEAFAAHSEEFGNLVPMMINAGERSENLTIAFSEICIQLERDQKLKIGIWRNLIYPGVLFSMLVGFGIILSRNVLPELIQQFVENNKKLPLLTRIFIEITNVISHWKLNLGLIALIYALIKFMPKSKRMGLFWDKLSYKLPIIGTLRGLRSTYTFFRPLDIALLGKMTVLDGLKVAKKSLISVSASKEVDEALVNLSKGITFYEVMGQLTFITEREKTSIEVAERSANVPPTIHMIAESYYSKLSVLLNNIEKSVQPACIILIGLALILLLLAIMAPIAAVYTFML